MWRRHFVLNSKAKATDMECWEKLKWDTSLSLALDNYLKKINDHSLYKRIYIKKEITIFQLSWEEASCLSVTFKEPPETIVKGAIVHN